MPPSWELDFWRLLLVPSAISHLLLSSKEHINKRMFVKEEYCPTEGDPNWNCRRGVVQFKFEVDEAPRLFGLNTP